MKKKTPPHLPAPPCVVGEPDSELVAHCHDHEKLSWFMTARGAGQSLEDWARDALNEAAKQQLRRTDGS